MACDGDGQEAVPKAVNPGTRHTAEKSWRKPAPLSLTRGCSVSAAPCALPGLNCGIPPSIKVTIALHQINNITSLQSFVRKNSLIRPNSSRKYWLNLCYVNRSGH